MARFQLNWISTDITEDVILYKRTSSICEGIKAISLDLLDTSRGFGSWDALTLWEDGNKVGKFYIEDIVTKHDGTISISAQDNSFRLQRNFENRTWHPGWVSNAKYWISLWLDRAGVSYNFTAAGSGSTVNKDVTFGNAFTWEMIMPLLQQSGWYMIFDENDVLQIGELDVDTKSVSETFYETDITEIKYIKNDKTARNRVVVWGGRDLATDTWITGSAEANAGWQIDSNDDRTVVISSNAIRNYSSAYTTANKTLNEVIEVSKEKTLTITGYRNRTVGDLVHVTSRIYNGNGLITDLEVTANNTGGYVSTYTLDRQCPRLFAYFAWDGYVYIGTVGGGVYRKPFEIDSWSSYNSGLSNLNIKDLYIKDGIFVCVTGDGYAYKSTTALGYWTKLSHGQLTDIDEIVYEEEDVKAKVCTIDNTGTIIVGYTHEETEYSWMVHFNVYSGIVRTAQIVIDGETEFPIGDLDNTGEITLIGTEGEGLVNVEEIYVDGLTTCKNVWIESGGSPYDRLPVAKPSVDNYNTTITMDEGVTLVSQSVVFDGVYSYYGSSGSNPAYRFSGVTRYDSDTFTTLEVDLPVTHDCFYATTSIIDSNRAIHVVYEDTVGIKIFSINFTADTATLLKTIGTTPQPPIQTHSLSSGTVFVVYTDGATGTYVSVCSAGTSGTPFQAISTSFNDMTALTGGRVTPYELSGSKIALVGSDDEQITGSLVSLTGATSEDDVQLAPSYPTTGFQIRQFCPNGTYSKLFILIWRNDGTNQHLDIYTFDGSFSLHSSTNKGSGVVWDTHYIAKLSAWKGGTYLVETDITGGTTTVTSLEGGGYGSITSSIQNNDRISPRSDDYDGAFIVFDRSEGELQRHRGTSVTVLKEGVTDTLYIWLAGSSILTDSQRLYASLSGSILISGVGGAIVRDKYFDLPVTASGTFATILDEIPGTPKIEISRSAPAIVHTVGETSAHVFGLNNINNAVDVTDWNQLGSSYRIPMKQGRVYFKEEADGSFENMHFAVTSNDSEIRAFNTDLDREGEIVFSGAVVLSGSQSLHRIEISNGADPYFFVSTSGAPSQFFQKNTGSNIFSEQSTGLPSNNIRIIRVDDRIS